jgi:hypothetical protein
LACETERFRGNVAHASFAAGGRCDRLLCRSATPARCLLQLTNRRYEHVSTALTSHKGFAERGEVFGDDAMAATLID